MYSIQSIIGPRDIFPGYSIHSLKPNASRLLIQSMQDYGLPTAESEGRASRKRQRSMNQENDSEGNTKSSATTCQEIEKKSLAMSNLEDFRYFHPPVGMNPNISALETEAPPLFQGSREPFEKWNLHFEGIPNDSHHEHPDCGICGTSLHGSETFQCQTCSLVIHKSCLQYTTLKDQTSDSPLTQWACPICSLCAFCRKHPVNGIDNLEPSYFTCIFCPVKEPLIMMERMKSGLFSHSLCRFMVNVEQSQPKKCSICGEEGSGLVRNTSHFSITFHAI